MNKQDFYFELPKALIAQYPLPNRSDSRLLVYQRDNQVVQHHQFNQLTDFLKEGDLLVMNNSRVVKARLYGQKMTGGKVELLVERVLDEVNFLAHIKASKALRPGGVIALENHWRIEVLEKQEGLYLCRASDAIETIMERMGHIPLPPYIERGDEFADTERYQTIYAKHDGSVAAPTAGLHFDEMLLTQLKDKGVNIAYATLHVGAGTFQPVRVDAISEHKMHHERFEVSDNLYQAVINTKQQGNRVIAVGTTSMRSLESAARDGQFKSCRGDTDIFIYPGYEFKVCDGLITNFHLPESTLLMLVSAFIGYEKMRALYKEAVSEQYRFFSYGDASLLL